MQMKFFNADGVETQEFQGKQGDVVPFRVEAEGAGRIFAALSDLKSGDGAVLRREHTSILQTQCVDALGNYQELWTGAGTLWGYMEIPADCPAGRYSGALEIRREDGNASQEPVRLLVLPADGPSNLDDFTSLARIKWFQSRAYQDESVIPPPFVPVRCRDGRAELLGRAVSFGAFGLPAAIYSAFDGQGQIGGTESPVLDAPIRFSLTGEEFLETARDIREMEGAAEVYTRSESGRFLLESKGKLEPDGMYALTMRLTARTDATAAAELLVKPAKPRLFMGLGCPGGTMPKRLDFKWDRRVNQDGFWAGDVNGGCRVRLRDAVYHKPNVNIYYGYKPIKIPDSWGNGGQGGIAVTDGQITVYTGPRRMTAGESLDFGLDLWITPLKELDIRKQFSSRYYHTYRCESPEKWLETMKETGANIINIHHGTDLNPYINYPFYETEALRRFTDQVHRIGGRVKLYNTVRELTTRMKEFPILRSLGYEILEPSRGIEGASLWQDDARAWIAEHIGADIIPAWRQEITTGKYAGEVDASVLTNGQSRLCNYYVAGLKWLAEHAGIDGIYIDDVAFDRSTMKRVARLFSRRAGSQIDLHSWNHMDARAGKTSSALQYMELLPYVDRVWLGEGFDYENTAPEYWLVEMSGIPFGVMGEMLQNDGNFYRGMVFGETNRLGWGNVSPEPLWKLWDAFGIAKSRMYGWWSGDCPVKTGEPEVLATCYVRENRALVAVASWAAGEKAVTLRTEDTLGFVPGRIRIPEIPGRQAAATLAVGQPLTIAPNQGILALIES